MRRETLLELAVLAHALLPLVATTPSPKFESAATDGCYLTEGTPSLRDVARLTARRVMRSRSMSRGGEIRTHDLPAPSRTR